jgi:hypothetical protein
MMRSDGGLVETETVVEGVGDAEGLADGAGLSDVDGLGGVLMLRESTTASVKLMVMALLRVGESRIDSFTGRAPDPSYCDPWYTHPHTRQHTHQHTHAHTRTHTCNCSKPVSPVPHMVPAPLSATPSMPQHWPACTAHAHFTLTHSHTCAHSSLQLHPPRGKVP